MTRTAISVVKVAVLTAAMLSLTACQSESDKTDASSLAYKQGVPGGIKVDTRTVVATVTDIDTHRLTVTLLTPDGKKTAVKCDTAVVNFDLVKVGDQYMVTVTERLVTYLATTAPPPGSELTLFPPAPQGTKPAGVGVETAQVDATVAAIDLGAHTATLQFPDGTLQTVPVREDVSLKKRKIGERVVVSTTRTTVMSIAKPEK